MNNHRKKIPRHASSLFFRNRDGERERSEAFQIRASLQRFNTPAMRQSEEPTRKTALQLRLKELLVFELVKDGGREYQMMTLRGLYNHVLDSITATRRECASRELGALDASSKFGLQNSTLRTSRVSSVQPGRTDRAPKSRMEPPDGKDHAADAGVITYRERLGGYLHPRDMRRLVTPFSASNEPELIVRRHVMLLNFDPLRAIVLRDRLLVLVPDGADSILIDLEARVQGGLAELEKSVFGDELQQKAEEVAAEVAELGTGSSHEKSKLKSWKPDFLKLSGHKENQDKQKQQSGENEKGKLPEIDENAEHEESDRSMDGDMDDEFDELNERKWIDLPFELQCVDGVLQTVVALLDEDVAELQKHSLAIIEDLLDPHHSSLQGEGSQDTLRRLKNGVGEMAARVQGFVRAMNLMLDDDEDLALMNLSRLITHPERFIQPVPIEILHEESDEPELILEAFLQQGLSTANALELLKGIIGTTNELVGQKLDSVRNRLLYVNTVVSLCSLCVAVASLVGSYFGMNLTNNLETDPDAFRQVVTGTTVGVFLLAILLFWTAWSLGALPTNV